MKRLVLSAALLLLCFAVAVVGYFKIENGCVSMIILLENAGTSIKANDIEKAKEDLDEVGTLWERDRKSFGIYLDHKELESLEYSFPTLINLLAAGNAETAFEEIQKCISVLKNISEEQKICADNIL